MHPRKVIRSAVHAILLNATAAGTRVYKSRKVPHRKAELPVINIYTLEENIEEDSISMAPRELERNISLVLEGWVAVPDDAPDDAMDDLAEEIETAMHADFYLGDTVSDSILQSTVLDIFPDGDRLMGMVALVYSVTKRSIVPTPPDNLDDFERAGVTHNASGAIAEDLVTVEAA